MSEIQRITNENRPIKSKRITILRSGCILVSEFCERLAYYSIDANLLLLFINNIGLATAQANMLALFWKGTGYVTPLIGGWLADGYWGRYKTIIVFVILYVFSMILLAIGVLPSVLSSQPWVTFLALFLVAIGMGGIKANVVTFGADQFQGASDETKQTFFNWFYFSINFGSVISFTAIAYVQQEEGFTIGLAIPAGVMFLSAIFFVSGSSIYTKLPATGSVLSRSISMIYHCFKAPKSAKMPSVGFLDRAKFIENKGQTMFSFKEVEDLKTFTKIIPVQCTFIMFWCLYAQMSSMFYSQGTVMNLKLGEIMLPLSSLQVFNSAGIMILVPLFDRLIYPLLRKKNINFSILRRIGTGFFFATLAMIYAGCIEVWRMSLYRENHVIWQKLGDKQVLAVDLSILWQAPGFVLIGIGEVLTSITGYEFAYGQAPSTMRSMVQSIYLLTTALGSYLGSALVAIINAVTREQPWIQDQLNHSKLDLYFFTLAVLGFLNLYLFMYIASNYEMRVPEPEKEEETNSFVVLDE